MKGEPIAFIGTVGVPNRYGGFESFVEHCGPAFLRLGHPVVVTCEARRYPDRSPAWGGMERVFVAVPANGAWSILHDLLAFLRVYASNRCIVVLGVSGGIWFPLFRLLCDLGRRRLLVNIDGIEWRREKFGRLRRRMLWLLDRLAQRFAHRVVIDNEGLRELVLRGAEAKTHCIAYPGDHVLRVDGVARQPGTALTVCRIEPENNLELMIEGALASTLSSYTIVGNWDHSAFGRDLRRRYASEPRLRLLDPVYDLPALSRLRESCAIYMHGHSVGGTNPSLVEMLFYDCRILCFDVCFNRHTAGSGAEYFDSAAALRTLIDGPGAATGPRAAIRALYRADRIAAQYLEALKRN